MSEKAFQRNLKSTFSIVVVAVAVCCCVPLVFSQTALRPSELEQPITVNGDTVEYSTDNREITASGNVSVDYRGTKLSCNKISVNTTTKEARATGNVRVEDENGVITGEDIRYNFEKKTGTMFDGAFRSNPYFGMAPRIERVSESEFIALNGYATTCSFDHPHYRLKSKQINFFPGQKIQTRGNGFYTGRLPLFYLPWYNHSLKDPLYHVQFTPGKSSDWGAFMLSAWRYELTDSIKGRIYLDYRSKLGVAEGFGTNYTTSQMGKGDFKYYYTHEQPAHLPEGPSDFQRYLVRWRHGWDIDPRTHATAEYYKIEDSKRQLHAGHNFLKDYFYREYEKDAQPRSYVLLHHSFDYSSLDFFVQKRTNRWYEHTDKVPDEKLPELLYTLPEYKLGDSPLYFKNTTIFSNLANKYPVPTDQQEDVVRLDTFNQLSLPFRAAIFNLNPFVGTRETYYSRDKEGQDIDPRTVFYSGLDLSTKFYRLFDVDSDLFGIEINGVRHIITPSVKYGYNHEPTVSSNKLNIFDELDSISRSNKMTVELMNKFQTKRFNKKREKETVDFASFKISSDYTFKPKSETGISGSSFSDLLFDLELIPYSWLRIESDVTYDHFADTVKSANLDLYATFAPERSFGIGHRYDSDGGKELTTELNWRLTPKWRFKIYERYQFAASRGRGFKEQEYTLSRDLHCWLMDLSLNIDETKGNTVWVAFKLKALPETEIKFDQSYHTPKPDAE